MQPTKGYIMFIRTCYLASHAVTFYRGGHLTGTLLCKDSDVPVFLQRRGPGSSSNATIRGLGLFKCFHPLERLRGVITTRRYTNPRLPLCENRILVA